LAISLLEQAKTPDLCHFFLYREESIPFSVEYFYQWLVEHDVNLSIYEEIAAAVLSDSVSRVLDVAVSQMFLSRAIRQQHRDSSHKVTYVNPSSLDEGDEL
jgi:hypothetical protein